MRYLVPVICFAAAAFVYHYNATHDDSWLLFPFLDFIPSLKGDVEAQAEWSWRIVAAIGVFVLISTIISDVRRRRSQPKSES